MVPQSERREFDSLIGLDKISAYMWVIWVSMYQSITINTTNMYITRARVQFKINRSVEINTCSFQADCQFSSSALVSPWELSFWDSLFGVWSKRAGELAADDCERRALGTTVSRLFHGLCVFLCQSITTNTSNVYVMCINIYVYPNFYAASKSVVHILSTRGASGEAIGFVGCMRGVKYGGQLQQLSKIPAHRLVTLINTAKTLWNHYLLT